MTDIAWSPILTEKGRIEAGETVTRDKLGVDKDEYESLKAAGSIRETKYPKDLGDFESPRERNMRYLKEAVETATENAFSDIEFITDGNVELAPEAPASAPS